MTIHKLKLNAAYYDDSASGIKTFEIRKNDRNFKVGDILELREYVWSNLEKRGAYGKPLPKRRWANETLTKHLQH